jgi:hypothetical protein
MLWVAKDIAFIGARVSAIFAEMKADIPTLKAQVSLDPSLTFGLSLMNPPTSRKVFIHCVDFKITTLRSSLACSRICGLETVGGYYENWDWYFGLISASRGVGHARERGKEDAR